MNDYFKKWCCVIAFDKPFSAGDITSSDDIYKAGLEEMKNACSSLGCHYYIYADEVHEDEFLKQRPAGESDEASVTAAFRFAFESGYRKVILLNPNFSISAKSLEEGFSALKMIEFCVGPDSSGGYYLLGMNYFEPALFENSGSPVFSGCKNMIRSIGQLRHMLYKLPVLGDNQYASVK